MRKFLPLMLFICSIGLIAATPKRKGASAPKPVDIDLVVDSATILADDYAEAVADKPEMIKSRMNALKRFYATYSTNKMVADSICNVIFKMYVDNLGRDNEARAHALKECFIEIADKDNENFGPLYVTELTIAQERLDTTAVANYINLLNDYSQRLGYDYDGVLTDASNYLHNIRTRRAIRDVLPGVWVSEDIANNAVCSGLKDGNYFGNDNNLSSTMILQIRDINHPIYDKNRTITIFPPSDCGLNVVKYRTPGERAIGTDTYVGIIDAWELPAHNMGSPDSAYITSCKSEFVQHIYYNNRQNHAKQIILNDSVYSAYIFWGNECLKRNKAEIGALLRTSGQVIQATTAGHFYRSKYSTADRIGANLMAGITSAGMNALADALMVSKDEIWSIEATLHLINPYCIEAELYGINVISKSNSSTPEVKEYNHKTRYYRWEPGDEVAFAGTVINNSSAGPWGISGLYFCHGLTKEEISDFKDKKNKFIKEYQLSFKDEKKRMKEELKGLRKGTEAHEHLKQKIKVFEEDWRNSWPYVRAWEKWNAESLAKLKAKSDNYKP